MSRDTINDVNNAYNVGYSTGVDEGRKDYEEICDDVDVLSEKIEKLKEENKKLRACISFYANVDMWRKQNQTTFSITSTFDIDHRFSVGGFSFGGQKARACLKELEDGSLA